jgi:hypothetical protein
MNVTFHALTALAIGHVAAPPRDLPALLPLRLAAPVLLAAVLSHGVLDGLKHSYPIPSTLDVLIAPALLLAWLPWLRPACRPLFVLAFLGAVLPDLIDLGPALAARLLGVPWPHPQPHLFPWHWPEGSGSLYRLSAAERVVSLTNHGLVVAACVGLIATHRQAFRRR